MKMNTKQALTLLISALAVLVLMVPLMVPIIILAFLPNPSLSIDSLKAKYPNSKFIRLKDGRVLEYQICGAGTMLKPVVATHGFAQTSGMYTLTFQAEIYKKLGL